MASLTKGAVKLRAQVDARWPKRDRASDGWVASAAHFSANPLSDHTPDRNGVVRALDIDEDLDPKKPGAMEKLAAELIEYAKSGKPGADRVSYIIYEGRIVSGSFKKTWWRWRRYFGSNPHNKHLHISFTKAADTDGRAWPLPSLAVPKK